MLFEGTTFTDIPHRKEWKDLAKKWAKWQSRRCGRYTALPVKRMPNTGGTAELYSCCSSCKFRKQSLGCKAMLHMHVNYFFFLPLMLCRITKNLVVRWCLSRGSMVGILVL
jgi:hypothetical protein